MKKYKMSRTSKLAYLFVTMLFFIGFDLYFVQLILNSLRFKMENNPVFDLIFVQNTGAAFSILENSKIFLIIFAIIALYTIISYMIRNVEKFSSFACFWTAMLLAGISCNLYERIAFGYVRDFFKLKFIDFPVFNISDIFINIGVLAIIIIIIKNKYLKK